LEITADEHDGLAMMPYVYGANANNTINGEPFPEINNIIDNWANFNAP